jgi:hypothetical protein
MRESAASLVGIFASQVAAASDTTLPFRDGRANAIFFQSHTVDATKSASFPYGSLPARSRFTADPVERCRICTTFARFQNLLVLVTEQGLILQIPTVWDIS